MPSTRLRRGVAVASLVALALGLAGPGRAAAAEEAGPNTGRISLSLGADYATDYYFRGIVQETRDLIVQPYAGITFALYQGAEGLTGLHLTVGTWNSLHWGPSGQDGGLGASDPRLWYESDFYATLAVELFKDLIFATTYTAYTSPNSVFSTVQEVAFGLAYNDERLLGAFALNPSVLLAVETKGQADAGHRGHRGVYFQLGVAPGLTIGPEGRYPVTVAVPVTLGLSLRDYYEFGTGKDSTFGYVSGGITVGVPLAFIPAGFGAWELKGGVQLLVLGKNPKQVNRGDGLEVIGMAGIAVSY